MSTTRSRLRKRHGMGNLRESQPPPPRNLSTPPHFQSTAPSSSATLFRHTPSTYTLVSSSEEESDETESEPTRACTLREDISLLKADTRGTRELVLALQETNNTLIEEVREMKMGLDNTLGAEVVDALAEAVAARLLHQPKTAGSAPAEVPRPGSGMQPTVSNVRGDLSIIASPEADAPSSKLEDRSTHLHNLSDATARRAFVITSIEPASDNIKQDPSVHRRHMFDEPVHHSIKSLSQESAVHASLALRNATQESSNSGSSLSTSQQNSDTAKETMATEIFHLDGKSSAGQPMSRPSPEGAHSGLLPIVNLHGEGHSAEDAVTSGEGMGLVPDEASTQALHSDVMSHEPCIEPTTFSFVPNMEAGNASKSLHTKTEPSMDQAVHAKRPAHEQDKGTEDQRIDGGMQSFNQPNDPFVADRHDSNEAGANIQELTFGIETFFDRTIHQSPSEYRASQADPTATPIFSAKRMTTPTSASTKHVTPPTSTTRNHQQATPKSSYKLPSTFESPRCRGTKHSTLTPCSRPAKHMRAGEARDEREGEGLTRCDYHLDQMYDFGTFGDVKEMKEYLGELKAGARASKDVKEVVQGPVDWVDGEGSVDRKMVQDHATTLGMRASPNVGMMD